MIKTVVVRQKLPSFFLKSNFDMTDFSLTKSHNSLMVVQRSCNGRAPVVRQ